jgi:hypothetical protein
VHKSGDNSPPQHEGAPHVVQLLAPVKAGSVVVAVVGL